MASIDEFKVVSGLAPSLPKSTTYLCNFRDSIKRAILEVLPFEEGSLPVKYLGVPLVSSRVKFRNEGPKFIGMMFVYLKKRVVLVFVRFGLLTWLYFQYIYGTSLVHIWNILTDKESLWVKWVHTNKLRGASFWNLPYRGKLSWSWRKLLQVQPILHNFIWVKIGDGQTVSAWYDVWCNVGPLSDRITPREIHSAGFTIDSKVSNLVTNGVWQGPSDWTSQLTVWNRVNQKAGSQPRPHRWDLIVDNLLQRAKKKSILNVVDKLCLAATVYFIWQE
uniref:uncharacterized protein LOC122593835 n=1 Tax=Erigeron canadensis TaxID=72917 RepID=UPI001CB99CB5|nr:uncharacterized protein LOC122593835 [Erigeron canadensis]